MSDGGRIYAAGESDDYPGKVVSEPEWVELSSRPDLWSLTTFGVTIINFILLVYIGFELGMF